MDLETRETRAPVQAPFETKLPLAPAQTGEEDPRRPLLPAPIWSCGDRDPPAAVWNDGHERVLVVRQRRAPVAAPPFYQAPGVSPAGKGDVEGDREGVRVEAPTHSFD